MQDSRNQNATALLAVEYDVLTMLMTSQVAANVVTGSSYLPDYSQGSDSKPQALRGTARLGPGPIDLRCICRCSANQLQRDAKIETCPRLSRHGKFQGFTDSAKDIAPGDTASIAFINRRPQCL